MSGIQGNSMQFQGAFFHTAMNMANSQVQQQQPQQLQQLGGLMKMMFQSLFQAAGQAMGQAMNQKGGNCHGAATPGFVPAPGNQQMLPQTPNLSEGGGQVNTGTATTATGQNTLQEGQMQGQMQGQFGFFFGSFTHGEIKQTPPPKPKGIKQIKDNPPAFETPGGYKVISEGKSAAWKIVTPEGKTTRIWGDPHVQEGDRKGHWDFKKDMSFVLPDGTKITCRCTPPRPNGYTVSSGIDIMNGSQVATINGIDKNKPTTKGVSNDRHAVDMKTKDGDIAFLGGDGDDWFLNGKREIVGSSHKGAVLKTKAGTNTEITDAARATAQEGGEANMAQQPKWGGNQFMQMMMQQLLSMVFQQMFMGIR